MNLDRVPYRAEVVGWSPQQLADYLKMSSTQTNMLDCAEVVLKNSISGSRFVNLSESDLQKFPKVHMPMVSKISNEIRKKEKRGPFGKKLMPKYQEPEVPADSEGWGDGEFDDSDDDYESPCSGGEDGSGGDYESPNEDSDGGSYEDPPSEPSEDAKLPQIWDRGDGEYIDGKRSNNPPPVVKPRPPPNANNLFPDPTAEPKKDASPHAGQPAVKFPPQPPRVNRGIKPGSGSGNSLTNSAGLQNSSLGRSSTQSRKPPVSTPDLSTRSKAPVLPPPPSSSMSRSHSSVSSRFDRRREQTHEEDQKHNTFPLPVKSLASRPGLPGPPARHGDSLPPSVPSSASLPHRLHPALPESRGSVMDRHSFRPLPPTSAANKELDPCWYVGNVSRHSAEECLLRVQKDGAYVVRDSAQKLPSQPFTLMVLYQYKVFNIKIRQQNQQFLLGTGLKVQESFPSVAEIIGHYSKSPLLLIDGKNRSASQQNQCLLSDPAGHYITGQNRS